MLKEEIPSTYFPAGYAGGCAVHESRGGKKKE